MPANRGRRRRGGITVSDQRRDGLGSRPTPSPTLLNEIVGEGRDAVFALLSTNAGIDEVTEGLITKGRNAVFTLLQANVAGS